MPTCRICSEPFVWHTGTRSTCVGSLLRPQPPHDHDPNALARDYYCTAGHRTPVAMLSCCPLAECGYRGRIVSDRGSVWVEAWPEPAEEGDGDGLNHGR